MADPRGQEHLQLAQTYMGVQRGDYHHVEAPPFHHINAQLSQRQDPQHERHQQMAMQNLDSVRHRQLMPGAEDTGEEVDVADNEEMIEEEPADNDDHIPDHNGTLTMDGHGQYQALRGGADGGPNQLTLSYQGEVYVFDSVPPDKVHVECIDICKGPILCFMA